MSGPSREVLAGQDESHLCSAEEVERVGARVHRSVVGPWLRLRDDAAGEGFDLRIFSGFRGFDHQLSIWNRKALGQLAVLDSNAVPLEREKASDVEWVYAILRWSALPGGSRHHWGTDIDVIDEAARPEGYEVDLIPEEVDSGGMFGPFHDWLDGRIAGGQAHGFFRPYDRDRGGVAPERWHLSHAQTANPLEEQLSVGTLRAVLERADMELKHVVLEHLDDIHERFVINTNRITL